MEPPAVITPPDAEGRVLVNLELKVDADVLGRHEFVGPYYSIRIVMRSAIRAATEDSFPPKRRLVIINRS